jgi:hypothetical protein
LQGTKKCFSALFEKTSQMAQTLMTEERGDRKRRKGTGEEREEEWVT